MKLPTKLIIIIPNTILTLPCLLYFLVNFYWWLFDGNQINSDKIFAASTIALTTAFFSGIIAYGIEGDQL